MSTVEVYVLRPFPYSLDGYTEKHAKLHDTIPDFPERLFDGLNKAGYIRRAKIGDGHVSLRPVVTGEVKNVPAQPQAIGELIYNVSNEALASLAAAENASTETPSKTEENASDAAVEIPDDWRTLKFFALRSLAAKLSDTPIKNAEDAVAAIEAELARRG